ncbi:hypothetical protein Poli38472_010532 [Pythium oligandrum]|uniref:Mixed lineage kinase domain-containing protein n=1 Tax=Pythium oligandrum TaxID=41045 RepID=A0A8K1F9W3_PYTOL|nr:hypothetical protein Poli38472_010532 [Pythium oligandrum]|eukprot:TMW55650.1 hypothetical protein Poli38472_010532 [Pythium oligandrum]
MDLIVDIVMPGAGSAVSILSAIFQLCMEMKEGQETCKRVHARLADILTELQKMEKANRLPPSDSLSRYVEALRSFMEYLIRYKAKPHYLRLLQHSKMMDEVRAMHEEVDMLMKILNLSTTGAMMEWKQQWERDNATQMTNLDKISDNTSGC